MVTRVSLALSRRGDGQLVGAHTALGPLSHVTGNGSLVLVGAGAGVAGAGLGAGDGVRGQGLVPGLVRHGAEARVRRLPAKVTWV